MKLVGAYIGINLLGWGGYLAGLSEEPNTWYNLVGLGMMIIGMFVIYGVVGSGA